MNLIIESRWSTLDIFCYVSTTKFTLQELLGNICENSYQFTPPSPGEMMICTIDGKVYDQFCDSNISFYTLGNQ